MSRSIRTARAALLSLAVTGALGFGASQAFAGPSATSACSVSYAAGSCHTRKQCADLCAALGTNPAFSECRDGCCYCDIQ